MSMFVENMVEQFTQATSEPEVYRLQIAVQRLALPTEMVALAYHPLTPPSAKEWLSSMMSIVFEDGETPLQYTRQRVARQVSLYKPAEPRHVLILAFAGRANMLFGPLSMFLQSLAGSADVLVLGDHKQLGFTEGIPGYASSFGEMLERLKEDVGFNAYDDIRTFGTSGGGAAALAAGRKLGASVMVSFSGRLPTRSRQYGTSPGATEIEGLIRNKSGPGEAFAVFAADNKRDAENAELLVEAGGAAPIVLRGTKDHNTVFQLARAGKLRSFLNQIGMLAPPGHVVPLSRTIG